MFVNHQFPQGREPRIIHHLRYRRPVTAKDDRIQPTGLGPDDAQRHVGGGLERFPSLFLPPASEPLLRLAAGGTATLDVPGADLRGNQRPPLEDARCVTATPDHDDTHDPIPRGMGDQSAVRQRLVHP